MEEFDIGGHARLVGNVLIAFALFAFAIALAGALPDEMLALPPHFFGDAGAVVVGLLLLGGGLWLRRKGL